MQDLAINPHEGDTHNSPFLKIIHAYSDHCSHKDLMVILRSIKVKWLQARVLFITVIDLVRF